MTLRRWMSALLVIAVLGTSVGCETARRKFIRKRKVQRKEEPLFALEKEYRPEFSPEVRYQAHFAYWKAAHGDLLGGLGQMTQPRQLRAARQAIKELRAMQALLEGPPTSSLGALIEAMVAIEAQLANPSLTPSRLTMMRSTIESLRRRIDKGYDYHKVKAHLKPDLPKPAPAATPASDGP